MITKEYGIQIVRMISWAKHQHDPHLPMGDCRRAWNSREESSWGCCYQATFFIAAMATSI